MTFTDKAPTEAGFYAWKPGRQADESVAAVHVVDPKRLVGWDGLWCRLVPADETEAWPLLQRIKELEYLLQVTTLRQAEHHQNRLEEEVEKAFREGCWASMWEYALSDEQTSKTIKEEWDRSRARRVTEGKEE